MRPSRRHTRQRNFKGALFLESLVTLDIESAVPKADEDRVARCLGHCHRAKIVVAIIPE